MKQMFPLLALLFATAVQAQTIYKCVGADGQTSFSGSPCTADQKPMSVRFKDKEIDVSAAPRIARPTLSAQAVALGSARPPSPKP